MTETTDTDAGSGRPAGLARLAGRPAASEWVAAAGVGAVAVAFVLSPDHIEDGPVLCPFRALTGLPCPGCGMTRSFVYLAHGWWSHAVAANPFGLVVAAAVLALAVAVVLARVRGAAPPDLEAVSRHRWARVVIGAWLAFGVVRLALAAA